MNACFENVHAVAVGGETRALWFTKDMWYTIMVSADRWRPKSGVYKEDEKVLRGRRARQKRHTAALSASGNDWDLAS
jgi:hypothetical protein